MRTRDYDNFYDNSYDNELFTTISNNKARTCDYDNFYNNFYYVQTLFLIKTRIFDYDYINDKLKYIICLFVFLNNKKRKKFVYVMNIL
jgi:hypothetical protein